MAESRPFDTDTDTDTDTHVRTHTHTHKHIHTHRVKLIATHNKDAKTAAERQSASQ